LPVDVNIKLTEPAVVSAVLGVYVGFKTEAELSVPVPMVDQVPVPVDEYPLSTAAGLFLQTDIVDPAMTSGAGVKLTFIVLVDAVQLPLPVVANVMVTLPAVVSAALAK
jgi:hypothetical protein